MAVQSINEKAKVLTMSHWFYVTDPWILGALVLAAFAAGLMDAIAGGGGIITIPALLVAGIPPTHALATNKLQAPFGSGAALRKYAKAGLVPREDAVPSILWTALGAMVGAFTVRFLPTAWLSGLIPILLTLILVYLLFQPRWGAESRPALWPKSLFYAVFGVVIGFYDGFLGPGTGTFWTVALISILGYGLPKATAQTKLVNFTSNLVSLGVFIVLGQVIWGLGLLMGLGQALGATIGARLALVRGAGFIRWVFLAVAAATLVKVLWTALF